MMMGGSAFSGRSSSREVDGDTFGAYMTSG